jgi:hypothetical protein
MTEDGEQQQQPRFPVGRAAIVIVGMLLGIVGVVLTETGYAVGRTLILAGLPIGLVGVLTLLLRREAPVVVPQPPTGPGGLTAEELTAIMQAAGVRLNLELVEGKLVGVHKGKRVEATAQIPVGPISVRAYVDRHLDLGLTVMRGKPQGDARREVPLGDAEFDAAYCVLVDEPERAKSILTDRLKALLLKAEAEVDDAGVLLFMPGCDDASLHHALRLAVKMAHELERASAYARCAEPLQEARDAWHGFANAHHLATADTPLSIWGSIDGVEVSAVSVRDSFQHFHFELEANFAEPINRGLKLRPASSATQFDRSGEPVGHPAFDKVFLLKARDPSDAARLMGPETRSAMLEMRDGGLQMRASDDGLWAWVGLNRSDSTHVTVGLKRMVQVATRIAHNAARFPPRM